MLRAYAIPCGSIGPRALSRNEEAALACLVDAISSRITLVLTRPELSALSAAIDRITSSLERNRLKERLMLELSNCGPGIHVLEDSPDQSSSVRDWSELVKSGQVDAILAPLAVSGRPASQHVSGCRLGFESAAEEVYRLPYVQNLSDCTDEQSLELRLKPLFRLGSELTVLDPYLVAEALRQECGGARANEGLGFIVRVAARAARRASARLAVRIISSRKQFDQAFRDLRKRERISSSVTLTDAYGLAVGALRIWIGSQVEQAGLQMDRAEIRVEWVEATLDRGCISSRRVWNVEHSLLSLGDLLDSLRRGRRAHSCRVRLQLLRDASEASIRELAQEAR
jgi:hypothetical protein